MCVQFSFCRALLTKLNRQKDELFSVSVLKNSNGGGGWGGILFLVLRAYYVVCGHLLLEISS